MTVDCRDSAGCDVQCCATQHTAPAPGERDFLPGRELFMSRVLCECDECGAGAGLRQVEFRAGGPVSQTKKAWPPF